MAKLPIATQCGTDAPAAPPRLDSSFRWNDEMGGGNLFHSNRSCRRSPAHQGMNSRSCGLVQRISTADSATPHPDPCGGQAPALHFLIPPSAIGLQFGTFRRWRAGIEVDWRAHPGSESGTCFRTNRSCRLPPAHQGMKMRLGRWKCLGMVGATLPLWIAAPYRGTGMLPIAGITMALRGPHKRMKMERRVSFFHRLVALPLPTASGFRPSPE